MVVEVVIEFPARMLMLILTQILELVADYRDFMMHTIRWLHLIVNLALKTVQHETLQIARLALAELIRTQLPKIQGFEYVRQDIMIVEVSRLQTIE